MLLWVLVILLLVAALGGGWGYGRYGAVGFSPVGLIVLILVLALLLGWL